MPHIYHFLLWWELLRSNLLVSVMIVMQYWLILYCALDLHIICLLILGASLILLCFTGVLGETGGESCHHPHSEPEKRRLWHSESLNYSLPCSGRPVGWDGCTPCLSVSFFAFHDQIPGTIILGVWLFLKLCISNVWCEFALLFSCSC